MYKKHDINLLYLCIGLLLWLLTIAFIDNVYVLILIFVGVFAFNKKNNSLLFFMIMLTTLFLVLKFIDNSMSLANIMLMIDYIIIFATNVNKEEFITVKNIILNKKFTYKQLDEVYRKEISEKNLDKLEKYSINEEKKEEIKARLASKNDDDVFDKLAINYIRFYKNQNDNNKKLGINKETIIYLVVHVVILILAVVIK